MVNAIKEQTQGKFKFTIAEMVYYVYFALMVFVKGIGLYDGMWPYDMALIIGAALIVFKLCLTEHTVAEWLWVSGLLALGLVVWYNSGEKGAIIYIAMIAAMKFVPVRRLFYLGLGIWGSTFVMQSVLTIAGWKDDFFVIHEKLGLGFIIRWSLGYPHPNVLQISFLMICAFILYLADLHGKKLVQVTFLMLFFNLYVFLYSVSYTGLILVVVYLFGNLYLSFRKKLTKTEKLLISLIFPACAAFSVLGPVLFQGKLWELCNKVLNTRFNIAKLYLLADPITLLGGRSSDAAPNWGIDCSYVFALVHYGLIFFVLLCAGYMALIHHCIKKEKHKELAIIIGLSVAAITEPFFVNPSYKNISLLFMGEFLFYLSGRYAERKPEHPLNRRICLCSLGKREFSVPTGGLQRWKSIYAETLQKGKWAIALGTALAAIAAGSIFAVRADMPSAYYAMRSSTQAEEERERLYLDLENLPEDFDGKILNYKDKETPMHRFDGNIVKVEYVRGIISSGLWCGLFAGMTVSVILFIGNQRKWRRRG